MKIALITVSVFFLCTIIVSGGIVYSQSIELNEQNNKVLVMSSTVSALNGKVSELEKQLDIKHFTDIMELSEFLYKDDTDKVYSNASYNSPACLRLVENAKKAGYYIGISVVSASSYSNYFVNSAVVNNKVYHIDPTTDKYYSAGLFADGVSGIRK